MNHLKNRTCIGLFMFLIAIGLTTGLCKTAKASTEDIQFITNTGLINLAVDAPTISLVLPYPGPNISGLCGVEIRADSYNRQKSIKNLLAALSVRKDLGATPIVSLKNNMTVLIDLSAASGSYGTWFSIRTKNGDSLSDTIKATLGDSRLVVLVGVRCH